MKETTPSGDLTHFINSQQTKQHKSTLQIPSAKDKESLKRSTLSDETQTKLLAQY